MKTVLVVEDSRTDQHLIVSLLKQFGLNVFCVDSAEAAQNWLQGNHRPNLIVLDIVMPGQSGLDLCRYIRQTPHLAEIPIVFCSSKDREFDQFWALRQGGNAYIAKPFVPNELLKTVQQQLN